MASASESVSINSNLRIIWFWQSNPHWWTDDEPQEWTRYSDFENNYIEEAYQRGQEEVQLNDYIINMEFCLQFKRDDRDRQIPVKREEVDVSQLMRQQRFNYPDRAVNAYDTEWKESHDFALNWHTNYYGNSNYGAPGVAERAAQGILEEGRLLDKEFDAERMAEQLRTAQGEEQIYERAVRLYTAESFLYKIVNASLRSKDMSKVRTLGPYCWLLYNSLLNKRTDTRQIVYRGVMLSDEMLEEYQRAVGRYGRWLAFTSTTKSRAVAERFAGNTIFIISINSQADISSLSAYESEQEVLLSPPCIFEIDRIEHDSTNGRHFIYMKTVR